MIPDGFALLEAIPLSPNGKLDRVALRAAVARALDGQVSAGAGEKQAPRTAAEQLLCEIWAELLGLDQVGTTDNFFALGGNSHLRGQGGVRRKGSRCRAFTALAAVSTT